MRSFIETNLIRIYIEKSDVVKDFYETTRKSISGEIATMFEKFGYSKSIISWDHDFNKDEDIFVCKAFFSLDLETETDIIIHIELFLDSMYAKNRLKNINNTKITVKRRTQDPIVVEEAMKVTPVSSSVLESKHSPSLFNKPLSETLVEFLNGDTRQLMIKSLADAQRFSTVAKELFFQD